MLTHIVMEMKIY